MYLRHFVFTLLIHFTTTQFPEHIDLQEVGETIHNNEKNKILKPTIHKITDYFEQFMLRTQPKTEGKIFVDNDGFRHIWKDIKKTANLNKIHKPSEINKDIPNYHVDVLSSKARTDKPILRAKATEADGATTKAKSKKSPKSKATTTKATTTESVPKKVAITTFFCPFLGVIKMNSIIE